MKKIFTIIIIVITSSILAIAQHNKNKESFEVFYKRADSINIIQPKIKIDENIIKKLKELDQKEPYYFFSEATSEYEFKNDKYDYAAVVFYVALIRYKYFMLVNPEYAPSDGWMICESMKQNYETRIELYLKTNIEKYKNVLKFAISYCSNNKYVYFKKPQNETALQKVVEPYLNLLHQLNNNKEKYEKEFQQERDIKLGKSIVNVNASVGLKQWFRCTPLQLNIDTATSKLDIYNYYKSERSSHHYKYVKAKERLAILEFIDKQNWNDTIKLEVFKLVTYDYGEKNPCKDFFGTKEEFEVELKERQKDIPLIKQNEKDRENKVKQLLGENEGRQFWSDVIEVRIKFGNEFATYLSR